MIDWLLRKSPEIVLPDREPIVMLRDKKRSFANSRSIQKDSQASGFRD